jgi:hypothetical protein
MRPRGLQLFLAALAVLVFTSTGFAQGGGASVTGSINGRVADSSGAVLPGVTATVTSPSMMGAQTSVTDANGTYRFPALPPGTYTITYELSGFNTLKRENIQIAMGFTATVNVELGVAALQETVTVTGDSPVIDTSNTRVQQNFKLEALQEIPNSRDMWSLLAVTPSVSMQRIDVGGNRAGTQTTYAAYGYSGQNRVLVEGINTTEGTSGAGFYTDYGSFEEVFLGTVGQGAEMPTPGVQSQMLGKSGGNKFQGEFYDDYETNGMISDNIAGNVPQQFMYNAVTNPSGIRDHSNETLKYRDTNINLGGPIKRDKVWWFFSYRNQKTSVGQPNFIGAAAGTPFDTKLWNPSGKVTYQINQNNKLIGYYQWGQKVQPNRLPSASFNYSDLGTTLTQTSGSWLYKGEWNGTINKNMYAEVRYGVFGYYFPLITNTDTALHEVVNSKLNQYFNGDQKEQTDRQRRQVTGAVTYFKDGMAGAHNFKVGGELLLESGWYGYTQVYSGNIRENIASSGLPASVNMAAPTATSVGNLGAGPDGDLTSVDKVTTFDWFVTDQWTYKRATMNLGLRFDHYDVWTPEQQQLAYTFPTGVAIPAVTFPEQHYLKWNSFVPRLGVTYDLFGSGKTVLKANYGLYRFNPGVGVANSANTNQASKTLTYAWTDTKTCAGCIPGDGIYEPGEEGNLTTSNLAGTIKVDPAIQQPYSQQATFFVEQQLTEGVGLRAGFVYLGVNNQIGTFQPLRPASAYTVPFTVNDVGPDGVANTADDVQRQYLGIPNSAISGCSATTTTVTPTCLYPTTNVITNSPDNGAYKTLELSLNKRQSHNYSLGTGFAYTAQHDFPRGYPNSPNAPADYDFSSYSFKITGSYNAPFGIILSPVYRFQSGLNYARTLNVTTPASCACTFTAANGGVSSGLTAASLSSTTTYVSNYNAYRQDNISVLDLRVEKSVQLGSQAKVRLFLDLFNIANAYAAETISYLTGSTFQAPTAILGPRTLRIGARFIF